MSDFKLTGKVNAIDFNEHSESMWEINTKRGIGTAYYTDWADTKADQIPLVGKDIRFNATIQLASIERTDSNESYLNCPRQSCYTEFSGKVLSVLDEDEVIVEILGNEFIVELEDNVELIAGEQIRGTGELRIDVKGIGS